MNAILIALALAASAPEPDAFHLPGDRWLGPDKALHLGCSLAITEVAFHGAGLLFPKIAQDKPARAFVALTVGLSAGVGKELLDAYSHNAFSGKDLTADAVGIATGLSIGLLVEHLTGWDGTW